MFIGHFGLGFAAKAAAPRVSLGTLMLAAQWLDLLWPTLLLLGALVYLSPEQTGRTNHTVDYRTDFYSLGMTFYELLTGKLPFPSDSAQESMISSKFLYVVGSPSPEKAMSLRRRRSAGTS